MTRLWYGILRRLRQLSCPTPGGSEAVGNVLLVRQGCCGSCFSGEGASWCVPLQARMSACRCQPPRTGRPVPLRGTCPSAAHRKSLPYPSRARAAGSASGPLTAHARSARHRQPRVDQARSAARQAYAVHPLRARSPTARSTSLPPGRQQAQGVRDRTTSSRLVGQRPTVAVAARCVVKLARLAFSEAGSVQGGSTARSWRDRTPTDAHEEVGARNRRIIGAPLPQPVDACCSSPGAWARPPGFRFTTSDADGHRVGVRSDPAS